MKIHGLQGLVLIFIGALLATVLRIVSFWLGGFRKSRQPANSSKRGKDLNKVDSHAISALRVIFDYTYYLLE